MTGRKWPTAARHSLMGSTPFAAVVHSASDIWCSRLLKTTLDLFQSDILATGENDTNPAPVAVGLPAIRFGRAVVRQRGQTGLSLFAKRLLFFGSVDAGHPDLVRNLLGVQQRERIAVTDTDDPTRQRLGGCVGRDQQEEQPHEQTVMHDRETPRQFDSQNTGTSLWTTAGKVP